ncbi:MAG: F-box protein [Parachlamydiales bacterium]
MDALPSDLSDLIFHRCDLPTIGAAGRTSKQFNVVTNRPRLWSMLVSRDLYPITVTDEGDWKGFYQRWKGRIVKAPQFTLVPSLFQSGGLPLLVGPVGNAFQASSPLLRDMPLLAPLLSLFPRKAQIPQVCAATSRYGMNPSILNFLQPRGVFTPASARIPLTAISRIEGPAIGYGEPWSVERLEAFFLLTQERPITPISFFPPDPPKIPPPPLLILPPPVFVHPSLSPTRDSDAPGAIFVIAFTAIVSLALLGQWARNRGVATQVEAARLLKRPIPLPATGSLYR